MSVSVSDSVRDRGERDRVGVSGECSVEASRSLVSEVALVTQARVRLVPIHTLA